MNKKLCENLMPYIETLYIINQKLIKLCGTSASTRYEYSHRELLYIIDNLVRVHPFGYNRKTKKLELMEDNCILEYKESIKYLEEDFENILYSNYDILNKIRILRNKYEHKIQSINCHETFSGADILFYFSFRVEIDGKKEKIEVQAREMIDLCISLNNLYSKIVKDIIEFKKSDNDKDKDKYIFDKYDYLSKISRFDFEDFNKIYNDEKLNIFGKLMLDF